MLDGFVAAITGPLEFEADGDHVLVTLKSGKRCMAASMSRCDLLRSLRGARAFMRTWDASAAEVVAFRAAEH